MKNALLLVTTIYGAVSCTGKVNLEEQIAAHGVYEQNSMVDNMWLKTTPKESVKIQSQKSLRIPLKETIWNQTTGKWQVVELHIHGVLNLFVLTKDNDKVWSTCSLDTYLTTDALTATMLYIQGSSMSGVKTLKDHTSMRSEIVQLALTESPHAPHLMNECERKMSIEKIKSIKHTYQSLLVTTWLENSSIPCKRSSDCQVWGNRFPKNWGKGQVSCRDGSDVSEKYCSFVAQPRASCPIYLTREGLNGHPEGEANVLVSHPNRSSLSCSKAGFMCLITGKKPDGLFESSCVPEIERYFSQVE